MSGKTPGQLAYEAFYDSFPGGYLPWEEMENAQNRAAWEAAAAAAIAHPSSHDGCVAQIAGLEASRAAKSGLATEILGTFHVGEFCALYKAHRMEAAVAPKVFANWRERAGLEDG